MRSLIVVILAIISFGCAKSPQPVQQNSAPPSNERGQTVIAHTTENQPPPAVKSGEKTKWTQSGEPIDTKEFDTAVTAAEKALSGKPSDPAAKKALSEAYFKRAVALTDARQYASALGDYRRAMKYDPQNAEAKDWIDKIIMIYDGMNKDYPKEGEEPPALPFPKAK